MNVIYDISALGRRFREPDWTGGLCRAIERVAVALKDSGECELRFSAAEYFDLLVHSEDYLKSVPYFPGCELDRPLGARFRRRIYKRLRHLDDKVARGGPGGLQLLTRTQRKILYQVDKAAARFTTNLIDDKTLAEADIFHSPLYPFPARTRSFPRLQRVITIYDMLPILRPDIALPGTDAWMKSLLAGIGREDNVICISECTRVDVCNYCPDLDPRRVFVTHLGADRAFHPEPDLQLQRDVRVRYGIPEAGPYLLSVATVLPHKNIEHLVRCFVKLCEQEKIADLSLVLAGHKAFWAKQTALNEVDRLGKWNERIIVTGYVQEEDLAPLYSGALGLAFPSIYEGFGLPTLEAMQCGTPVITSNTSSLPEVVGDAALTVAPTDGEALCQAILAIYHSEELRADLRVKGLAQAKKFSWEKCGEDTLNAYRSALSLG